MTDKLQFLIMLATATIVPATAQYFIDPPVASVCKDINFGPPCQSFGPGRYRADQGQLEIVGKKQISSLKVPLGLRVDLYENENGGRGSGKHKFFNGGDVYNFVGDDINDKTSLVIVSAGSEYYLSEDSIPEGWRPNPAVDGGAYSVTYRLTIPHGSQANLRQTSQHHTGAWTHWQDGETLFIKLMVHRTATTSISFQQTEIFRIRGENRDWIGVELTLEKQ